MTDSEEIYTGTMARLYAEQGYDQKAARVYRRLLAEAPHRQDLRDALAEIEVRLSAARTATASSLPQMFRQWIDLMMTYNVVMKLKRLDQRRK